MAAFVGAKNVSTVVVSFRAARTTGRSEHASLRRVRSGCASTISRSVRHSGSDGSAASSDAPSEAPGAGAAAAAGARARRWRRRLAYERRRSRPRYRFERLRLPLYRVRTERARLSENPRRPMVLASASPMYRLCASVTRADSARASTARSVDARRARRRIVGDGRGEGGARSAGPHRRRLRRVNHDATRENGRASRGSRQFLQPLDSETTDEISRLNALAMSDTTTNLRLPPVRLFSEKYNRPGGRKRDISRGC